MQVEPPSDESAAAAAALSLLNATPSSELTASQPPGYPSAALPAPPVLDPAAGTQMLMPMASPCGIPPYGMAPGWAPPGAYGMMMPSDAQPADMLGKRRRGEQPNKQGWTRQEDALILKTVREVGTKWSRIAAQLPGRSDDAVRNRYIRMKVRPAPAPPRTFLLSPGARPGGPLPAPPRPPVAPWHALGIHCHCPPCIIRRGNRRAPRTTTRTRRTTRRTRSRAALRWRRPTRTRS